MEKRRFAHEFALLFLLTLAVGAIVLQSNFKLTGNAILNQYTTETDCTTAGYSWENLTEEQCIDITNCTTCTTGCVSSYTETLCAEGCQTTCQTCEDVVTGGQCSGEICDSNNLNLCLDETTCEAASGYWYSDGCNAEEEECVENWECTSWSDCSGGTKTRTCTDANSCGTEAYIPSLSHSCTETTSTTSTTSTASTDSSDSSSTETVTSTCSPNWECGDWQECIESVQVRACTDLNNCGVQEGMPATSQACVVEITETCSDGIQNQDETGIDCGGNTCKKCSFFTLVGSVISGPVNSLGEVFSNKLNIFIFLGILVFGIVGFFVFRFFKKRK